jgi:L-alanine-DL-glutamate epimerase-like enolase superfamily enzyme
VVAVDANQGFTLEFLDWLMPVLVKARVALLEQPFPVGQEALLDEFQSQIRSRPTRAPSALRTSAGWHKTQPTRPRAHTSWPLMTPSSS